jgi:hypothetical protein
VLVVTGPVPAVSPYVPFYAETTPYITVAEFMSAPTGCDTSQLVQGASTEQNRSALQTLIASASGYADSLCYQVLAATVDMAVGEYRIFRDGTIRVPVPYTPLIEVTNVALGQRAGALQNLNDLSGLWIQRKTVRIPVAGLAYTQVGVGSPAACSRGGSMFAQVTYVNGYANTTLAVDAAAGASTIVVASPLGVFAGMPLTVYDDANSTTELVTVAASYVPGSASVPLVSPLHGAHTAGTAVSAMPRAIKQAVIALTAHLIKTRGAESLSLAGVSGGPSGIDKTEPGESEEYELAVDLLHPFKRVW